MCISRIDVNITYLRFLVQMLFLFCFVLFYFVLFVLYRCSELKVEVDRFRVVVEENERVVNDLRR